MKKTLSLLLVLVHVTAFGQPAWQLRKETEGIKIFTRNADSSRYKSVRVECSVQCSLQAITGVLLDIEKNPQWVFHVKKARLLKQISERELVYYGEFCTPWPFTNRDLVAHLRAELSPAGVLTIESHGEPQYISAAKGLVRIPYSHSIWTITSVSPTLQKLEYVVSFDPGGAIPAWLSNMFLTDGPSETFKSLRERVKRPEYQNVSFNFLHG